MSCWIKKRAVIVVPAEQTAKLLMQHAVLIDRDAVIVGYPEGATPEEVRDLVAAARVHAEVNS